MKARLLAVILFLGTGFCIHPPEAAGDTVGKVTMPQLTRMQWAYIRTQQGQRPHALPIDIDLSIQNGHVTRARMRRGTGYGPIDNAILDWIRANWKTYPWFRGGDLFVVSLNVDPASRQIAFRKTQ